MSGERDLDRLLAGLAPVLDGRDWFFARLAPGVRPDAGLNALMTFREEEGWTAVVEGNAARGAGLDAEGPFARITCSVHSSLEAVGMTAAIAGALAAEGIPCNAVAAFYHDHFFVPTDRGREAFAVLTRLAGGR